ncbi:MAG TPA: N-acetylglucosamine-6-phosphate deacetylase [Chitinophagaceae bacterium]|nr:N-acetylglucosamine-6-phosphate deacetylase [Chitinophagaceae bacterium]
MLNQQIFYADKLFTGDEWLHDYAVVVDGYIIKEIVPISAIGSEMQVVGFEECILIPAFIDLQIYGAYGKLLAVYPEAESLYKLNDYCRKGGAVVSLPTVATNSYEVFRHSIDAINDYWKQGGEGILGIHLEGPWIHVAKRGAHIETFIHSPTFDEVKEILDYGKDVIKMITLAPELCSDEIIKYILNAGIVISAGHSNATYDEARQSFEKGITAATHLYNAMSPLQHRNPGLVGAILDDDKVMASIIPDGYHVDFAAIRIAKKILGERLFAITDAVTDTVTGAYQHYLAGDKYEAAGILSGSALNMIKAFQNLVNKARIETGEAIRMCSLYPARVLKIDDRYGKIAPGYKAAFNILDKNLELIKITGSH